MSTFPATERSRGRRKHDRIHHEHQAIHDILDATPLCNIGYVIDGEPYVTPTIHWRVNNRVYWHGSSASRFLRKVIDQRVCLTVSLFDGYVMAHSAFNHSANYRSAMVFGRAQLITDPEYAADALKTMIDDFFPNRWDSLRPMTTQELKATTVLYLDIEEASAKTRSGPPGDTPDRDHPVWTGVLPVETRLGLPVSADGTQHATPEDLMTLCLSGRLR